MRSLVSLSFPWFLEKENISNEKIFVLCVLFCVGLVIAQRRPPQPVEENTFGDWSGRAIKASIAQLKPGERPTLSRLNRGNHNFNLSFRTSSGRPEMHSNWTDVYFVQHGEATLIYGGQLEAATERRPGEFGGGKIVGGSRQKLVAGDIASAPPGMPHHWVVEDGKTIAYITLKVEK